MYFLKMPKLRCEVKQPQRFNLTFAGSADVCPRINYETAENTKIRV